MAQAVRYFTEVLLDGHIPLPPEINQDKIRPGSRVEVILMLEDDSERELEELLTGFRIREIVKEADARGERGR